jgi:hypothetical protein
MNSNSTIQVRFGDWISEGWKMFTEQWKGWVTIALGFFVVVILPIGAFVVGWYALFITSLMAQQPSPGRPPEMPAAAFLLLYAGMFALIVVLLPLTVFLIAGAYRAAFKQLRGGKVEFRDLFSARDCYWRLLGATLLHAVLVSIGAMLCFIPAFIVAGLLFFTAPLIVERDLGVFEAMRVSRDVTQRNLLMFTLFAFVVQFLASVGSYACYLGLLVTWPLMFTITAVAYRDCFGVEGARSFAQPSSAQQQGYGAPPTQPSVVCPNCQASLPSTAQYCFRCGASVR